MEPNRRLKRMNSAEGFESLLRRLAMGEIRAKVMLVNLRDKLLLGEGELADKSVRSQEIEAIADTGAVLTLLPKDIVERLGLKTLRQVVVQLADDQKITLDLAGALEMTILGRTMTTDCLVGPRGCAPLIGQVVMEALDLIADPAKRALTPRPESPDMPLLNLKGSRFVEAPLEAPAIGRA